MVSATKSVEDNLKEENRKLKAQVESQAETIKQLQKNVKQAKATEGSVKVFQLMRIC
jgi:hypothetical protein